MSGFGVKLRGCLTRALMAGFATLITLFLLDGGMRLIEARRIFSVEHRPDIPQVYRFPPGETLDEVVHGDIRQPGDPIVQSWRVHWVIDAYGYRNETIPARVDTVLLGDSFGSLPVSQEGLLSTRLGGCGRSVYNLSVSAQGPWQEYATLILEQDRLAIQPGAALIWMVFGGNDMDDIYLPVYGNAIKTDLTRQGAGPNLFNFVVDSPLAHLTAGVLAPHQSRLFDPHGGSLLFYEPYVQRARRSADDIRALPNYPLLRDTFKALADDARQRQMKPLVVVIPSKEEVYYYGKASGFGSVIGDLASENHMDLIDLTPEFLRRAAQGEMLYFAQDTHWNEYAQQVAAGLICEQLGKAG